MTGRIQAILAVPALLAALLPGVAHAADLPACAPNQATTGPCIIELDSLGTQPLVQTLPFDVPVFLVGTASAELERMVVHIFRGDTEFRVDEQCDDPVVANTCRYTCYRQGDDTAKSEKKATWDRADLLTAAKLEECGVVPNAAEWRSPNALSPRATPAPTNPDGAPVATDSDPSSGGGKYRLRLPPMPPNEHIVILIEEEKRASREQRARVEERVNDALVTVLENNADLSPNDATLNVWLTKIREEGCEVLRGVARAEGVKLTAREGTLFDCGGPQISGTAPALHDDLRALGEFYSASTEIESNLEGCGEDSGHLAMKLAELRDLLDGEAAFPTSRALLQPILEAPSAEALAGGHWDADLPAPAGPDPGNPCINADLPRLADGYQRLAASLAAAKRELPGSDEPDQLQAVVESAWASAESMRGHAGALAVPVRRQRVSRSVSTRVSQSNWLMADTIGTFLTRQKGYIAADFGFAFAPELETAVPYLGTNIYLRPVNKNAPLRGLFNRPMQRFSFSIGLALTEIDDDQVGPLFDDFSLLTGAGVRVTESARLSGGVVWVREKSQSALNDDSSLTWSPYVAVSLDYDVKSLIKWFDKAFGGSG